MIVAPGALTYVIVALRLTLSVIVLQAYTSTTQTHRAPMKINEAYKMIKSKTQALANIRERAKEEAGHVIQIAEVSGTALALSAIDGYRGKTLEVGGIDGALLIGLGLHGFGFVAGGSEATHIHNFADGALAKAAVRYGNDIGKKMAEKSSDSDSTHGTDTRALPAGNAGGYGRSFARDLQRVG